MTRGLTVQKLSVNQRDLLVAHVSGPYEMINSTRYLTRAKHTLLAAGFLKAVPFGEPHARITALSEKGREAVCTVLAEAADMLVRAGLLEQDDPIEAMGRLQTMRRMPPPEQGK